VLRAKTYEHITMVAKKKNYSCHFCAFLTPLFLTLKNHIRDNHLEATGRRAADRRRSQSFESSMDMAAVEERPARARSDESLMATPDVMASKRSQNQPSGGTR